MRKLGNVLRKSIPTVAALVTAVAGIYLAIANINEVALVIGGDILNRFMLGLILLVEVGMIGEALYLLLHALHREAHRLAVLHVNSRRLDRGRALPFQCSSRA